MWKRIFGMRHLATYQAGGFRCFVWPDVNYISLRTPENNPGWRTKWFYARDQPTAGRHIGLKEFHAASDLQVRQSWENVVSAEEMAITEPLMQKILELRSTPGKEVTRFQLIHTFIELWIQPWAARTHCMWEYSCRRDSTRLSVDELKEAKVDEKVCTLNSLLKKHDVPMVFGTEPFSKAHPHTEVLYLSKLFDLL
jgi:hypothetical protein